MARGGRWERLGHWRLAAADYRAALARLLAEAPGRGDLEEAVQRARVAGDLQPTGGTYRQTLGLALYRAGRFAEAATVAESNYSRSGLRFSSPWDRGGIDRLVLAMSWQRLGQAAAARAALAEAIGWRAARPDLRPDRAAAFDRLLREARSVLAEDLPDLPADVFARE